MMKPGIYLELEQLSGAPTEVITWFNTVMFGGTAPAPTAAASASEEVTEDSGRDPAEPAESKEDEAARKRSERAKKAAETRRKNAEAKKAAEKAAEAEAKTDDDPVEPAESGDSGASEASEDAENDLLGGDDGHPVDQLSDDDLPGPAELVDMCRTYMAANGADAVKAALAGVGAKKVSDCEKPEQIRNLIKELGLTVER